MDLNLSEVPKKPIIIEGFPGFGLIGSIVTEFLLEHCDSKLIGKHWFEEQNATVAIHDSKVIHPIGIFYNKQYNLVFVHAIAATAGIEWKAADLIVKIADATEAKQLICIEGVGTTTETDTGKVYYHTNNEKIAAKLKEQKLEPLKEGIILGITSAILLKADLPICCFFAETHSALPDSKAAAKIIEVLDSYLGLKIDPKPLLKQAEKFEEKLKSIMEKGQLAMDAQEKKQMSYVG